jgi:hypothetical protein
VVAAGLSLQLIKGSSSFTIWLPPLYVVPGEPVAQSFQRVLCVAAGGAGLKAIPSVTQLDSTQFLQSLGRYSSDCVDPSRKSCSTTHTLFFSSRPILPSDLGVASGSGCARWPTVASSALARQPTAPATFCDVFLSSGDEISSTTACRVAPTIPPGSAALLSRLLFRFDLGRGATEGGGNASLSIPFLHATAISCLLVDGEPVVADDDSFGSRGWVGLGGILGDATGVHTIEILHVSNTRAAPPSFFVRQSVSSYGHTPSTATYGIGKLSTSHTINETSPLKFCD